MPKNHLHQEIIRQILESMAAVVVTDVDDRIVYVNERYAKILGVSPNAAVGKPVQELIPGTRMPIITRTGQEDIGSLFVMKNGETIIVNRLPIQKNGKTMGAIAFSTLSRIDQLNTLSTFEKINQLTFEINQYKFELGKLRGARYSLDQIVGSTPVMTKIKEDVFKLAQIKSTVLITGETGTGKELFAHAIHQHSPRNHKPFIRLNCAAIPKDLLEAELFGYEEGAFTGAKKGGKPGKFELAHGGTLFLDEINQLSFDLQSKILRVMQEKEFERVGGIKTIEVDVRLICTSNRDLLELVREGAFREDLYYRIHVCVIHVPPLRERLEDIPQLANHLIGKINRENGLHITGIQSKVLQLFQSYDWPGNIRELEHVLERAAVMAGNGELKMANFDFFYSRFLREKTPQPLEIQPCLGTVREQAERAAIIDALKKAKGNKKLASKFLKINRSVLYDKLNKYRLNFPLDGPALFS